MHRSNNKPYLRRTIVLGMFLCACLGASLSAKAQNTQTDQASAAPAQQEISRTSSPSEVVALSPQTENPEKTAEISFIEPENSAQETNTAVSASLSPLQSGLASYYGKWFHGRKTANGEIFNMTTLTAAHPTLPFGTLLKVTNTQNDQSVVVRVNDRGPYKGQRIIDLSHYAASKIGMLSRGLATVVIEIFKP